MDVFSVDWRNLFIPSESLLEMFLRGSITYLFIIFLLRTIKKRHTGALSSSDFLFVLFLAASAHYSLTGGQRSITFGLGVILTIVFWNFGLNWLSYRSRTVRNFLNPPPLSIIHDGQFLKRNMRMEFITEDEVRTELRKHGVTSIEKVKEAHIEADGELSFILYEKERTSPKPRKVI